MIGKGNHRHFMLKETHEQPAVIGDTLQSYLDPMTRTARLPRCRRLTQVSRVTFIGCGTALYAGMVGKYWFEKLARLPVEVEIASEFRYREAPMPPASVRGGLSAGETVDTLAALRYAKSQGQTIVSVVNVPESAIARESHAILPTLAGPEIGVPRRRPSRRSSPCCCVRAIAAGRHAAHSLAPRRRGW